MGKWDPNGENSRSLTAEEFCTKAARRTGRRCDQTHLPKVPRGQTPPPILTTSAASTLDRPPSPP